jgi:signal transduction histidine kinase
MAAVPNFASLVTLACHDLRTPLATVHGFARTLDRVEPLQERARRYLGLMADASEEMADLLDRLALVARIESGRYEPVVQTADSLELARSAAGQVKAGPVEIRGEGVPVEVDREWTERSLAAYAQCAIRHGDSDRIAIEVRGAELHYAPVTAESGPVLLGDELRDLGAAAARRLVEALGGSVSVSGDSLVVALPTSAGATAAGP